MPIILVELHFSAEKHDRLEGAEMQKLTDKSQLISRDGVWVGLVWVGIVFGLILIQVVLVCGFFQITELFLIQFFHIWIF